MARGDEIISGSITLNDLVGMVVDILNQRATGVGEFPVAGSLNGISSLPAIRGAGTTNEIVSVSLSLLKGVDGVDGKTAKFSIGTVSSSAAGGAASVTLAADGLDENANPKFKLNFILPRGQNGAGIAVRVTASAVQYKYEGEADGAYRTMFTIDQLRLKFSDLTASQKDELTLHFSDLTADNLAALKQPATDAAAIANTAATNANAAKNAANVAAVLANQKAAEANDTIILMQELAESLVGQYKLIPTGMELDYPKTVTYRNSSVMKIAYSLLPANTGRNVLFLGDNNAVTVMPDGGLVVNRPGISRIFAIPTENTNIYQTIEITVTEPALRKFKTNALRFMGNGNFRLT